MKKIYKIAIYIDPHASFKIANGKFVVGLLPSVWYAIKRKLNKKYKFQEIYIDSKNINWEKDIEDIEQQKYDIIIGGFGFLKKEKNM